jgi:hypothetical protein
MNRIRGTRQSGQGRNETETVRRTARGVNDGSCGRTAMRDDRTRPRQGERERVLLVAQDHALSAVGAEAARRGAEVGALTEVAAAAAAVRRVAYDVVMVAARTDPRATALLTTLLKADALGAPRLLLLVDTADAARHAAAMQAADETLAIGLPARRICDAAGLGLGAGFQPAAAFG